MSQPKRVTVGAGVVAGLSVRTNTANELKSKEAELPGLWERFFKDAIGLTPAGSNPKEPLYAVYSDYDSDDKGNYSVTAGTLVGDPESVPESFAVAEILAGEYLVFEGSGKMPDVVVATWQEVWSYFANGGDFRRSFGTDFELYRGDDCVAIHIGVSPIKG